MAGAMWNVGNGAGWKRAREEDVYGHLPAGGRRRLRTEAGDLMDNLVIEERLSLRRVTVEHAQRSIEGCSKERKSLCNRA